MSIFGKRIDNESFFYGMGATALLCIIPIVSKPVSELLASVRDKVSEMLPAK